jgi:sugar phosphate permease
MRVNPTQAATNGRVHYAWVIVLVTFAVLIITAGVRATPGVLMVSLETEFGWTTAAISGAIAINIALFGVIGPFAASAMNRFGIRRIILGAVALLGASVALTTRMQTIWQMTLLWGICVGTGTGVTAMVLAATVTTRWFETRRGLVLGLLSAANATGQLVFLPVLARTIALHGWRSAVWIVSGAAALVFIVVLIFMRDRPEDVGLRPYGQAPDAATQPPLPSLRPLAALRLALRSPAYWALGGTFFVCGASTNGLIGTHLIAACHDVGIPEVQSAQLLAMMGIFDIVGTTASGWLTDRFSARYLLFGYYTLRGLSLLALPHTLQADPTALNIFAVFYGLDWIATVPPTVRLTTESFGKENTAVIYGWIGACHQMGASLAAFGAGAIRTNLGAYQLAFWTAGVLCVLAGLVFVTVGKLAFRPAPQLAEALA